MFLNLNLSAYKRLFYWLPALLFPLILHAEPPEITIYVTVDWEGWALEEDNLQAMRDFRKRHPQIPMLQLLNPVYFLRPNTDVALTKRLIRSTFLPHDGMGLHLHGWKSIVEHCGLTYQSKPSYAGEKETCESGECGYTVSLEHAYSEADLTKLIACSTGLLETHGFGRAQHFRAGGWQAGAKLFAALKANKFTFDSSRIPPDLLLTRWQSDSAMIEFLRALHGNSAYDAPQDLGDGLMEYPNNAALADYTSSEQIIEIFNRLLTEGHSIMVLGFHQETADAFLYQMETAIPQMEKAAKAANVRLKWATYAP